MTFWKIALRKKLMILYLLAAVVVVVVVATTVLDTISFPYKRQIHALDRYVVCIHGICLCLCTDNVLIFI